MGLDMYAWKCKEEDMVDKHADIDIKMREEKDNSDKVLDKLFYWRKHAWFHGWMEQLYRSRGGSDEFNCVKIRLFNEDLDSLAEAIDNGELPETHGFFFGNYPPDDESNARDHLFIAKAKEAIKQGYVVLYDSWW